MRLVAMCAVLAVLWLVFLPWVGRQPELRRQIESFDHQGVDPSAMYYTDLELMPRVYARTARALQEHPRAFFAPGYQDD